MKSVKIAQFKAELAKYLRVVRKGGEVIVTDRDTPIARVIPISAPSLTAPLEIEEAVDASENAGLECLKIRLRALQSLRNSQKPFDSLAALTEERS